ncbi:MAG TPA: hypothetical protein EYP67_01850 [Methanosarcinales archaeon]|nr:hypothetical protein [Methanosarcinales archaeon]
MFIIDDLLLRQVGISIPGLDLIWIFEQIRDFAYREMYDPEKIRNRIKENRLLYEFEEIDREEYDRTNTELMRQLKLAEMGQEMNLGVRMDILGAR